MQTFHRVVDDGALAHAVDSTQDIHVGAQLPFNMAAALPQCLNLYLADVFCLFSHSLLCFPQI